MFSIEQSWLFLVSWSVSTTGKRLRRRTPNHLYLNTCVSFRETHKLFHVKMLAKLAIVDLGGRGNLGNFEAEEFRHQVNNVLPTLPHYRNSKILFLLIFPECENLDSSTKLRCSENSKVASISHRRYDGQIVYFFGKFWKLRKGGTSHDLRETRFL